VRNWESGAAGKGLKREKKLPTWEDVTGKGRIQEERGKNIVQKGTYNRDKKSFMVGDLPISGSIQKDGKRS